MFSEHLMPAAVMPNYESTLLDQTYKAAVRQQIDYGKSRGVPWGIQNRLQYNPMCIKTTGIAPLSVQGWYQTRTGP